MSQSEIDLYMSGSLKHRTSRTKPFWDWFETVFIPVVINRKFWKPHLSTCVLPMHIVKGCKYVLGICRLSGYTGLISEFYKVKSNDILKIHVDQGTAPVKR